MCSDSKMYDDAPTSIYLHLTSFLADSPARTSAAPEKEPVSKESVADCGQNTPALLASFDHATSSWKTWQLCFTGELSEFSETWPRAGMTRNGRAYELSTLVPRTSGIESGLWPTPSVAGGGNPPQLLTPHKGHFIRRSGQKEHLLLDQAVKMWPTPNATDGSKAPKYFARGNPSLPQAVKLWATPIRRDSRTFKGAMRSPNAMGAEPLVVQVGGTLNPRWVEWLMGYPDGWTDCEDSETQSSQKLQSVSAEDF